MNYGPVFVAATLAFSLLAPAPLASASDGGNTKAEASAEAIKEAVIAANEDDSPLIKPEVSTSDTIVSSVGEGTVEIHKEGTDATTVLDGGADGLKVSIGLPTAANAKEATTAADGTTIYNDPQGLVDVGVQTLEDGSFRALTVINGKDAPEEYVYKLEVPTGITLRPESDGSITLADADGNSQGSIQPAWAIDANGTPVETRYEIEGSSVTQIVNHQGAGVMYPVVADPKIYYAWWQLFTWSEWRWNATYGMNQLSMELSSWGRSDVILNAGQFVNSGWNLLKTKHSSWIFTASMRQQWECHVLGGIAEWGTFDLEYERRSLPNWRDRIGRVSPLSATCNW